MPHLDLAAVTGNWRGVRDLGRDGLALGSRIDRAVAGTGSIVLPEGRWQAEIDLLPTYADADGDPLRLIVSIDGKSYPVAATRATGDPAWAQAVLDNRITLALPAALGPGVHRIELAAKDGGVLIEALRFVPRGGK